MGCLGWEELSPSGELGFPGPVLGERLLKAGCGSRTRDPKSGTGAHLTLHSPCRPPPRAPLILAAGCQQAPAPRCHGACLGGGWMCLPPPKTHLWGRGGLCSDPAAEGGEAGAAGAPQERADRRPQPAPAGSPVPAAVSGPSPAQQPPARGSPPPPARTHGSSC